MREETRCQNMGYSFRLAARVLLYASSNTKDNTYHSLCYTSRGALPGTRNTGMTRSCPRDRGLLGYTLQPDTSDFSKVLLGRKYNCSMTAVVTVLYFRIRIGARCSCGKRVRSWCDELSDRSFMGWTH